MRYINAIPLTALNGEHSEMKIESVPMEFLTDSQVSYDYRSYESNLNNCIHLRKIPVACETYMKKTSIYELKGCPYYVS